MWIWLLAKVLLQLAFSCSLVSFNFELQLGSFLYLVPAVLILGFSCGFVNHVLAKSFLKLAFSCSLVCLSFELQFGSF